ncbi:MAG TPA: hypothetical protein VHE61_21670 [Opitutaceae bacterium]|nr:hypothetical protein [Opitutaceae bacterium]
MGACPPTHPIGVFRRRLATGCAALIFGLGLCAVSPALHKHLHSSAGTSSDAGCVVLVFANGVSTAQPVVVVPLPPQEWRAQPYRTATEIFRESPRYLLQPERGPPIA